MSMLYTVGLDAFLEMCASPSKLDGGIITSKDLEIPLVGFTGNGSLHERNGMKSAWVNGQILSPNFIRGDGSSNLSHIEGIVMNRGEMRLWEVAYGNPYHGSCAEFDLIVDNGATDLEFHGVQRAITIHTGFKPVEDGEVYLRINNNWQRGDGASSNPSLPYHKRNPTRDLVVPRFWAEFLGQLEEQGFEHPYEAVTDKLAKERREKSVKTPGKVEEDLPF